MDIDLPINQKLEAIEREGLKLPQVECPLEHRFTKATATKPAQYIRTVTMPAGTLVIGHAHKTGHWNCVETGKALVNIGGRRRTIEAPYAFRSEPGVRKALFILEEMVFTTVHNTEETDIAKLEELMVEKSTAYLEHKAAGNLSNPAQSAIDARELLELLD